MMANNSNHELAQHSDANGDEEITILKQEANDTSIILNSTSSATQRFHITTGKVVDTGSVHVLRGVVGTLQQRIKELTDDNKRLKANFRRTIQTRQSADSSLPANLINSLQNVSSEGRHTGLRSDSSLQVFHDDSSQNHSMSVKDHDLRIMEGEFKAQKDVYMYKITKAEIKLEEQLKALQIKADKLSNENKKLKTHVQENENKAIDIISILEVKITEMENLKKRNSALENDNKKILKEKEVFEKQVKTKEKELLNLNKDFSDYKQQVEAKQDSSQVLPNEKPKSSPEQTLLAGSALDKLLVRSLNEVRQAEKDVKFLYQQCKDQMDVINQLAERKNKRTNKRELKSKTKNLSDICKSEEYPVNNATEDASNVSIPYKIALPKQFKTEKQKLETPSSSNNENVQSKLCDNSSDLLVPVKLKVHRESDLDFFRNNSGSSHNFKISETQAPFNLFVKTDSDLYSVTELTECDKLNSDQFPRDDAISKNVHSRQQPDGATALDNFVEFNVKQYFADYSHPPRVMLDNSATKQPVQEYGGSPHICPTCHSRFSKSMSITYFQNHILDCNPDAVEYGTEYDSLEERACPVCNAIYPASIPQVEFEQHVMFHFANEPGKFEIVN